MSSLVHSSSSPVADARPAVRLLERPACQVRAPAPAVQESLGGWLVRQVERYWAWGEGVEHHRLGSWLRR